RRGTHPREKSYPDTAGHSGCEPVAEPGAQIRCGAGHVWREYGNHRSMTRSTSLFSALIIVMALAGSKSAQSAASLNDVIRSGDAARAMEMLKHGAAAQSIDPDGTTALHWAARLDDIRLARALLAAGAKAGSANRYGVTPLELAAVNGSAPMVEMLLNAG